MNDEERIYNETEILRVLYGLANVYWSKPWYIRWLHKPWFEALQTAAMILCQNRLQMNYENQAVADTAEKFMTDN